MRVKDAVGVLVKVGVGLVHRFVIFTVDTIDGVLK